MAVERRGYKAAGSNANITSATLGLASGWTGAAPQTGDSVLVTITTGDAAAASPTPPANWEWIFGPTTAGSSHRSWLYHRLLQTGDTDPTWSMVSNSWAVSASAYSGVDLVTPILTSLSGTGAAAMSHTSPEIVTSLTAFVLSIYTLDPLATETGSPWTSVASPATKWWEDTLGASVISNSFGDRGEVAAGTYSDTWSHTVSSTMAAALYTVALQGPVARPGVSLPLRRLKVQQQQPNRKLAGISGRGSL